LQDDEQAIADVGGFFLDLNLAGLGADHESLI